MTGLRTAAQQALEAICSAKLCEFNSMSSRREMVRLMDEAITALRAALAQQQAKPQGCDHCRHPLYAATRCRVCGRVTEQAEPVEPVAWVRLEAWKSGKDWPDDCFAALPAEGLTPLYTAPPKAEPLTEEEIRDLWSWAMTAEAERTATTQQHAFARAIERAHGIGDNP